jgi:hypothetical protein
MEPDQDTLALVENASPDELKMLAIVAITMFGAQQTYFRSGRQHRHLVASKTWESRFDRELRGIRLRRFREDVTTQIIPDQAAI